MARDDLSDWLNALEGMSEADLADFDKMMAEGVWLWAASVNDESRFASNKRIL